MLGTQLPGSRYWGWLSWHPRRCCEGPCSAQPLDPPWSSFAAPIPHILNLTPCSPHPAPHTWRCWGCLSSRSDRIGQWGWHLPVPTLQAGRGRQSCVEPAATQLLMVSPQLQLLSELRLPAQCGWQHRWGQAGVGRCSWAAQGGPGVLILGPGVPVVWLGSQYWCVVLGAVVLKLELESCHCALGILGTGNTGQQEHGKPEALGSPNQWSPGDTVGPGSMGALGAPGVWGTGICCGLGMVLPCSVLPLRLSKPCPFSRSPAFLSPFPQGQDGEEAPKVKISG